MQNQVQISVGISMKNAATAMHNFFNAIYPSSEYVVQVFLAIVASNKSYPSLLSAVETVFVSSRPIEIGSYDHVYRIIWNEPHKTVMNVKCAVVCAAMTIDNLINGMLEETQALH